MFKCVDCKKKFKTERALSGHKSIHRKNGRYSVSRKKNKANICLFCLLEYFGNKGSKFCSIKCSGLYEWKQTKIKIENNEQISSGALKKYLLEKNPFCDWCTQGIVWNNKPLSLQHDHIDGDSDNNCLENSRLLCPNCHTQTETFGSKGHGSRYKKRTKRSLYLKQYKSRVGPKG